VFHNPVAMLLPSIGAALVILGGRSSFFGLALRNPVAAYLGQISYSVYLVHWPLIVFTEYFFFRGLTTSEAVKLFFFSIALGAALHHALEKPIHKRKLLNITPRYAGAVMTGLAAIAITLPVLLAIPDGLQWRVDANALGLRYDNTKTLVSKDILGHMGCTEPCVFGKENGPKILVFGDSHVDHFTKTLDRLGGDRYRFHYAGSASCFNGATLTTRVPSPGLTAACKKARDMLLRYVKTYQYKAVIIGQRWLAYGEALYRNDEALKFSDQATVEKAMLSDVAALLHGFKGPVIIAGWAPITNTACYTRPHYLPMTCPTISFAEYDIFRKVVTEFKTKTDLNMHFIDVANAICPNGRCTTTDAEGRILYTDSDHLSIYGAGLIVPTMLATIKDKEIAVCQGSKFDLQRPFSAVKGYAYVSSVPALVDTSDDMNHQIRSTAVLCEDGRSLGEPHTVHETIAKNGNGSYSHWGDSVIFSASDNSDPNSNGRVYSLVHPND
jgi:hypothetical protein